MDRCALFVDAGYLLADGAMAVHGTRHRETVSWDFGGLLQLLGNLGRERTGMPLLRCYWYEATVEGRRSPEHEALADLPGLKLRLGRVRPGRREGVDTEIHRDLMTLARNKAIADAIVVSGDEDLAQVIADAQDLGLRVTIVHVAVDGNWTISRGLRQECDDLIEIGSNHLRPYVNLLSGMDTSSSVLSNGHGGSSTGSMSSLSSGPLSSPPPSSPITGQPQLGAAAGVGPSNGLNNGLGSSGLGNNGLGSGIGSAGLNNNLGNGMNSGLGNNGLGNGINTGAQPVINTGLGNGIGSGIGGNGNGLGNNNSGLGNGLGSGIGGSGITQGMNNNGNGLGNNGLGANGLGGNINTGLGNGLGNGSQNGSQIPSSSPPIQSSPQSPSLSTGPQQYVPQSPQPTQQHGPYTGPQQIAPLPAQQNTPTLSDAVKAAHQEGQDFGESVARDAPALWLEAVLARKPRMPSDLEARLLQGSSLPIDFLLHDEVRHALRRGFWDALERSRR